MPFTWIIIFFVLLSLGGGIYALCASVTGNKDNNEFDLFQYVWLGYAVLIAILQVYSIFYPVNEYAMFWIGCLAVAGISLSWRTVAHCLASTVKSLSKLGSTALLGIVILAFLIAYHASFPLQLYDTELYHLNAVKWASSYPAIPGIANLHGRLAFNSSFHLFAALLNVGYWSNRTVYVANSFILFLACTQWFICLLPKPGHKVRFSYCFALITSPFLILSILRTNVSSLSTDLPTQLLFLVVIYYILDTVSIENGTIKASTNIGTHSTLSIMFIVTVSSIIASTKLSGAIVIAVIAPVISLQMWLTRRRYASRKLFALQMFLNSCPALIVLSGMVARYIILSGWIIYPFPLGNLYMDWSARPAQVATELDWIRSWARMPGKFPADVLGNGFSHWFVPWYNLFFARNWIAHILLVAGLAGLLFLCFSKSAKNYRNVQGAPLLLAIAITLMGLVYWFVTAPDYRFGEVFFWAFAGTSLVPLIGAAIHGHVRGNFLAVSVIIIFLSLQKMQGGFPEMFPVKVSLWDLPVSKSRKVIPVRVNNGQSPPLLIFRPLYGDRCGNSPLPCSPGVTPESTIELRIPGEIRSGFKIK